MRFKRMAALFLCLYIVLSFLPMDGAATPEVTVDKDALLSGLFEADIATVREAISEGLITSEELTGYYLDRIEQYNKNYKCFITICEDALEVARQRDAQIQKGEGNGLLFGVPIVIKDNIDLAGYHTTNGHKKEDSQIKDKNADVVQSLLDEGAVIIAKTNMSTDARNAQWSNSEIVGETKNAYNHHLSAGGSSGGSAVSVSLNMAMAALGTDTNSSLRIPAAFNGCVALRPTYGLLSREGVTKLNGTRDTAGAITRTVVDQAIMLDVLTGGAFNYTKNLNKDALKGLRIGILKELSYPTKLDSHRNEKEIDDEIEAAFERAVNELRACGAEVVEVSMPNIFTLVNKTLSSNTASLKENLYNTFMDMLRDNNVSAVIFPSSLSTPLRSGRDENGKYWNIWDQYLINNCKTISSSASLPEISIPIGLHSMGAGIGMEIAAPRNCEQLLLDIAYAYTEEYDHRVVPTGAPDSFLSANQGTLRQVLDDYYARLAAAEQETTAPETTVPETTEESVPSQPQTPQKKRTLLPILLVSGAIVVLLGWLIWDISKNKTKCRQ